MERPALPLRHLIVPDEQKEAASALPFTRRPAGVAQFRSLGRRQRLLAHPPRDLVRYSAGPCGPAESEVQARLLQLLVSKPAIEPVSGDVAHFVVEERPRRRASFEAEHDEVDR